MHRLVAFLFVLFQKVILMGKSSFQKKVAFMMQDVLCLINIIVLWNRLSLAQIIAYRKKTAKDHLRVMIKLQIFVLICNRVEVLLT